jgi:translation initiation factor IF-3
MILSRLADELAELAVIEQRPIQDGRNMTMLLAPAKAAAAEGAKPAKAAAADAKPAKAAAADAKPSEA